MESLLDFLCIGGQPQQVINGGSRVFLFIHWLLLRGEKVTAISLVLSLLTSRNKAPQSCAELICGPGTSGEQRWEEAVDSSYQHGTACLGRSLEEEWKRRERVEVKMMWDRLFFNSSLWPVGKRAATLTLCTKADPQTAVDWSIFVCVTLILAGKRGCVPVIFNRSENLTQN